MRALGFLVAAVLALGLAPMSAQVSFEGTDLYAVDLSTGALRRIGAIGDGETVIGLALPAPSTSAGTIYALTTDNELLSFSRTAPETMLNRVDVQGLGSESLIAIDFRPATGDLYALSDANVVYVVDPESGEAQAVGGPFSPAIEDTALGFDFNPTVDRIRVDVGTGQNLRLNPDTGQVGMDAMTGQPTVDGRLTYATGDVNAGSQPFVVAAGYANNLAGSEATQLYVIDAGSNVLALQDPPNDGVLSTVGALGVDTTNVTGFDIAPTGEAFAAIATTLKMPSTGTGASVVAGSGAIGWAAVAAIVGLVAGAFAVRRRTATAS